MGRGGTDRAIHVASLGRGNPERTENATGVDGVFHLLDFWRSGMGRGAERADQEGTDFLVRHGKGRFRKRPLQLRPSRVARRKATSFGHLAKRGTTYRAATIEKEVAAMLAVMPHATKEARFGKRALQLQDSEPALVLGNVLQAADEAPAAA